MNNNLKKIAVLTSKESWIIPYCNNLISKLEEIYNSQLFFNHKDIDHSFDVVFILGYTRIIENEYLIKHRHNLVIHESDLPKGKGWAPLFWQILEGKTKIPVVIFEASNEVDDGKIYLKDYVELNGTELNSEIRKKQGEITIKLCLDFLNRYDRIEPYYPTGEETIYKKRTKKDSELDINKTIEEQFNLLRITNNEEYPAFFNYNGQRYILKITKDEPKE